MCFGASATWSLILSCMSKNHNFSIFMTPKSGAKTLLGHVLAVKTIVGLVGSAAEKFLQNFDFSSQNLETFKI